MLCAPSNYLQGSKTMTRLFASWNQPAVSILFLGLLVCSCILLRNRPLAAEDKYMKDMEVSAGDTSVPSAEGAPPSDQGVGPSGEYATPSDEEAPPSDQGAGPAGEVAAPSAEGAPPSDQGVGPSGEYTSPSAEGVPPSDQGVGPSGEYTVPSGEDVGQDD